MKLVKLITLAAIAAAVVMAFIGASTASATPTWIAVCLKLELLNCAKANLVKHPLLGRLIALVGPGKFNAGFVKVECSNGEGNSEVTGVGKSEIQSQQEKEFTGKLEKLTFAGCKGCTSVAVKTPQVVTLKMSADTEGWLLEANGSKVKFTGCPLSQVCTYETNLILAVEDNEKTDVIANPNGFEFQKVALESTALCAEKGKWETGATLFDWELDNATIPNGERHTAVSPSLIGANLLKTF
jgi:hypothetical protein